MLLEAKCLLIFIIKLNFQSFPCIMHTLLNKGMQSYHNKLVPGFLSTPELLIYYVCNIVSQLRDACVHN